MSTKPLIAVVDDDESAREATVGLVKALGFVAVSFRGAADCLASAELSRVDCVIADVRMPGMSGLELYRNLVASGRPIPTVLVTAYPDEALHRQALSAGVKCCLAKPLEPAGLLACLRQALDGGSGG